MHTTRLIVGLMTLGVCAGVQAQVSLSTVVDLALRNSPKIRMAQADLDRARAALSEAKDAYVPMVSTNAGVGRSSGAPLDVPVIYSISAQSLAFSFSQRDYIRSARAGIDSAQHALNEARIEVAEDATSSYVSLDNALRRRDVMNEQRSISQQLVDVTDARVTAGVDPHIDLTKSKRTMAQIRLQSLLLDDEVDSDAQHLATLTGLPSRSLTTSHESIPGFASPSPQSVQSSNTLASSEGIAAADYAARAKMLTARGDHHYLLRPQISFGANYSRVNTDFSNYTDYYPRFNGRPADPATGTPATRNTPNSLSVGMQITIPLLDMVHHAKALISEADAVRSMAEAEQQRGTFLEGRVKLQHAARELDARREVAMLDRDLAQDQLETIRLQLQASAANLQGPQMTPKDELGARLQERQKYYDVLASELQLRQTQVNLLRQGGGLADWIHQSIGSPGTVSPWPVVVPQTTAPGTTGTPTTTTPTGTPATLPPTTIPR